MMDDIKIGLVVGSDEETVCPACGSEDIDRVHHHADSMPECYYWRCGMCEHEWGHA